MRAAPLAVPVVGPLASPIAVATTPCTDPAGGGANGPLTFHASLLSGLYQTAAVTFATVGLAKRKRRWVREDLATKRWKLQPMDVVSGSGLELTLRL